MDQIEHKCIKVNGLKLHVADIGNGSSVVLFLHGFPEIWYSWRHQMVAVANAGFRAIAPDFRGYGLSDTPSEPENTTFADLLSDTVALLDALGVTKVFVIGKDFGVQIAYSMALVHPERVNGIIALNLPFSPVPATMFLKQVPEGFYVNRWREPGRAEAEFSRLDAKSVVRNIYILFSKSELPIAKENQEIMDLVEPSTPLPPWFTEEDLATYGSLYNKSGFHTALKVPYRSMHEEYKVTNPRVEIPTLLIMGEEDYCFKFPGIEDYVRSGQVKYFVPNLEIKYLPQGSHFLQEQFPDQVNQLIINYLRNNN